jgi:CMP/dCMP kinase
LCAQLVTLKVENMTNSRIPVVTIDGPSGTGKGTLAHMLAEELAWHILDSGALYRVVAVGAEALGITALDVAALCSFARDMDVRFSSEFPGSILLNGREISSLVRQETSGAKASLVAAIPEIRQALLQRQHAFRQPPGLVADGRDMGTVVFPDALLKIYLTASAATRAERRHKQLINKGLGGNLRGLLLDIQRRDQRDSTRAVSPLRPADDALVIDTDRLTAAEVFALVRQEVFSRLPE